MAEALRQRGHRVTAQRLAVVRALAGDSSHPTAQALYERLHGRVRGLSVATVYNTLAVLRAAGLCEELSLGPGASRFDPMVAPHDHAVCDRCGAVRDIFAPGASAPSEALLPEGFRVRAVERVVRGLCAACTTAAALDGRARAP
ncbi:MAG: transcriptional repressor [Deltaproteobacteria bacterium]|nr:transcriptional repressor [Deltaproteobacteria bacterium]